MRDAKTDSTELEQMIFFPFEMGGKELVAKITHIYDNPLYYEYGITFSDGHMDRFTVVDGGYVTASKPESAKYSAAIAKDIKMMGPITPNDYVLCMLHVFNGERGNIWVTRGFEDNLRDFKVTYQDDYRFTVRFTGERVPEVVTEHKVFDMREGRNEPIDRDILEEVIMRIVEK